MTGKILKSFAVCAFLFAAGAYAPAPGQDRASGKSAESRAKEEDVRRLLTLMGSGKVGVQMMDQMFGTIRNSMRQRVPPGVWDELVAEVKAEFGPEKLVELNVPIYARHYTHEEIKQLIAFYESPVGRKVSEVTPLIVREAYDAGTIYGRLVLEKIYERLRKKGYKPPAT